ncbi:MAG: hypothetical protein U5K76_04205 [Woeseiaceae bacterium]|nr:hypothetical protein [Woeseiaceae bacterium]
MPLFLLTATLLAGCGRGGPDDAASGPPPLTAATLGNQSPRPIADYLAEPRYAGASAELGTRLLTQCRACHSLAADAPHRLGPNLHGVFGRPVGTAEGYGYTQALRNADFTWTPRALDAWLANPTRFLPGNAMAYAGLRHEEDRDALIAALLRATAPVATNSTEGDEDATGSDND